MILHAVSTDILHESGMPKHRTSFDDFQLHNTIQQTENVDFPNASDAVAGSYKEASNETSLNSIFTQTINNSSVGTAGSRHESHIPVTKTNSSGNLTTARNKNKKIAYNQNINTVQVNYDSKEPIRRNSQTHQSVPASILSRLKRTRNKARKTVTIRDTSYSGINNKKNSEGTYVSEHNVTDTDSLNDSIMNKSGIYTNKSASLNKSNSSRIITSSNCNMSLLSAMVPDNQNEGIDDDSTGQSYLIIMLSVLTCLAILFALFGLFSKAEAFQGKEDEDDTLLFDAEHGTMFDGMTVL